jgi:hypothetical protein
MADVSQRSYVYTELLLCRASRGYTLKVNQPGLRGDKQNSTQDEPHDFDLHRYGRKLVLPVTNYECLDHLKADDRCSAGAAQQSLSDTTRWNPHLLAGKYIN